MIHFPDYFSTIVLTVFFLVFYFSAAAIEVLSVAARYWMSFARVAMATRRPAETIIESLRDSN